MWARPLCLEVCKTDGVTACFYVLLEFNGGRKGRGLYDVNWHESEFFGVGTPRVVFLLFPSCLLVSLQRCLCGPPGEPRKQRSSPTACDCISRAAQALGIAVSTRRPVAALRRCKPRLAKCRPPCGSAMVQSRRRHRPPGADELRGLKARNQRAPPLQRRRAPRKPSNRLRSAQTKPR